MSKSKTVKIKPASAGIKSTGRSAKVKNVLVNDIPVSNSKILTIAHNHPEFYPGGGEKFAYQMFLELASRTNYSSTFLAATGDISRKAHIGTPFLAFDGRDNEFLYHSDNFDYFKQSNREMGFLYNDFAKFITEHKPDIVHLHHTLRMGVECIKIIRDILPQCAIVYTLHDFIPICNRDGQMLKKKDDALCSSASPAKCHECFPQISSALFKMREIFIKTHFSLVDFFVSPSNMLAERFIEWGLPKEKVCVIQNGTEAGGIAPHRAITKTESRNRFAFFGQISPYKGTTLILDAVKTLVQHGVNDFSVSIHGNVSLQTEEFQKAFAAKLASSEGKAQFHGVYTPESLPKLMQDVDWVVVPSIWWENSPLVIAEAMRHKRPVICSDIGGMAEKIQHGVNGLHFAVRDSFSLAEVMKKAIADTSIWDKLVKGINSPSTIQECVDEYTVLYQKILVDKKVGK